MILVSPAEPEPIKRAMRGIEWTSSILPEQYGVDFMWVHGDKRYGVQRKEVHDLLASVGDRLTREVGQMKMLDQAALVIEGRVEFTTQDTLVTKGFGQSWTRARWQGVVWSLQAQGVWVGYSANHRDTVDYVTGMETWTSKDRHSSLGVRSKESVRRDPLLRYAGSRDWQIFFLQGLDGVSHTLATRILDTVGFPFQWRVSLDELMQVPGIGRKKAEKIMGCIGELDGSS